jgi:hypothetical protein
MASITRQATLSLDGGVAGPQTPVPQSPTIPIVSFGWARSAPTLWGAAGGKIGPVILILVVIEQAFEPAEIARPIFADARHFRKPDRLGEFVDLMEIDPERFGLPNGREDGRGIVAVEVHLAGIDIVGDPSNQAQNVMGCVEIQ